ncbi:Sulfur carrier protein TusA [Carnimonas sp. R-84981]
MRCDTETHTILEQHRSGAAQLIRDKEREEQMASEDQSSSGADKVVDARGLACPLPLLKAKQALAGMAVGQRLELWASDPGSWADIASFVALSAHQLVLKEQVNDDYHYILVRG